MIIKLDDGTKIDTDKIVYYTGDSVYGNYLVLDGIVEYINLSDNDLKMLDFALKGDKKYPSK